MKSNRLTFLRIAAIVLIFICASIAWFTLGTALVIRTEQASAQLGGLVSESWGEPLTQAHPTAWFASPTGAGGKQFILPDGADVRVSLEFDPKQKGLLWYRTFWVDFEGAYRIINPTPIAQTLFVSFALPCAKTSYYDVEFLLGDESVTRTAPVDGVLSRAIVVEAGASVPLRVAYRARGQERWGYNFHGISRIRDFVLTMQTGFAAIDFPAGTGSPTERAVAPDGGWELVWDYPDLIAPQGIGMEMPRVLNAGPVASRISFFAPVSLLFFFSVILILGVVRGTNLHPMNYFFLAAGFFAFQLLFAYLVDVLPVTVAFFVAAGVSLALVTAYVRGVGGPGLAKISAAAQVAYMVLFSYSFFFDGLSGLTIAIGAVATLALLMFASVRVDWSERFAKNQAAMGSLGQ